MSEPILRAGEGLLILPLGGAIDLLRARQLAEQLVHRILDDRARVVVLDLTGVPELEREAANHLGSTASVCRCMGAEMVVTGLSARVSQVIASAQVDLANMSLHGDLQSGLEYALRRLHGSGP